MESARETSLQMNSVSEEKAAALTEVTGLESKLKDKCRGHDVESQGLQADLVALQSPIDALEIQLAKTNPEGGFIQSEVEASMPDATSHDEFQTADDNNDGR
jgi:TRAP-type uncharacterized transport system substrate-binding protein